MRMFRSPGKRTTPRLSLTRLKQTITVDRLTTLQSYPGPESQLVGTDVRLEPLERC